MGQMMQRVWRFLGFAEDDEGRAPQADPHRRRVPILSLHAPRAMEIVVLEPGSLGEARIAADYLKTHRSIVINLRAVEKALGERIVDFLSGVAYALDGHMQGVGEEIFLFTPHYVSITAEHLREEMVAGALFPVE